MDVMRTAHAARERLDRGYLELRSRVLDIAAGLDRVERGSDADAVRADDRLRRLADAMRLVIDGKADRAQRVQLLFSLPYDANWRGKP